MSFQFNTIKIITTNLHFYIKKSNKMSPYLEFISDKIVFA